MEQTRSEQAGRVALGPARALGVLSLLTMVGLQVASGLAARPERFTGLIVAVLAVSAVAFAAGAWGTRRALAAFGAAVLTGYAAEVVGVLTGFPFGAYAYSDVLWPQVGGVPLVVAVAWGGMGLAAYAVAAAIVPSGGWARVCVGAAAMTAWDLFLDPQMVRLGLWTWAADDGFYRGIPLSNFAGWLLVSAVVMLAAGRIGGDAPPGRGLLALYTVMAVMETVAFAAVFDPTDPVVAVVGGITMGAFAALAWRRTWQK
ncbi:carotenoid biosynthesis protein [Nonomuraea sp. MCN248]|uniref:Carotenoid biosynthesis protein n=1 Tax=Nonomuraea corallina TaxID=2989783 RepID=A0ABT4S4I7_9ACTN|nr:carotenoid biosynthesis protein [Nonomuraea corallina]MDA0632122.1 carotenoid biosynthesis protein [Nonomuraea corallina]